MIRLIEVRQSPPQWVQEFLWKILKERPKEAALADMPTWEQHQQFVLYGNEFLAWYVIHAEIEKAYHPVGNIYLTRQGEVGIAILERYQRRGYAKKAIKEVMKRHPMQRYKAQVANLNYRSHALWVSMGGEVVSSTYEFNQMPEEPDDFT